MTAEPVTLPKLEIAWKTLVYSFDDQPTHTQQWFDQIVEMHDDRVVYNIFYTWYTVRTVFELFQKEDAGDSRVVEFAAWLHALVYDPDDPNCVYDSIDMAQKILIDLGFPPEFADQVSNIIETASDYFLDEDRLAVQILCDAQHSIWGANPRSYREYTTALRGDYFDVTEIEYCAWRKVELQEFLARPFIYYTSTMRNNYEKAARHNMSAEIRFLDKLKDKYMKIAQGV